MQACRHVAVVQLKIDDRAECEKTDQEGKNAQSREYEICAVCDKSRK